MKILSKVLAAALAAAALGACTSHDSYVKADQAALGRVVVYRNGIAYYERRASVDGDQLALQVPADKVDDFLKSLTVADAKTGESLPVSFPTAGVPAQAGTNLIDMVVQLPSKGHHDLVLTYITEAPAWKSSYRVVVADKGMQLQGWAIVDNTSGEDWNDVKVGVGSSSALSFRYDLRSIRTVQRATLESEKRFAVAPPTGESTYGGESPEAVVAQLDDKDIPRPAGHPDLVQRELAASVDEPQAAPAAATRGLDRLAAKAPAPPPDAYNAMADAKVDQLAQQLNATPAQDVTIEGYAQAGDADPAAQSLDRANLLRNRLIEKGVAPARLKAVGRGNVAGQAGVRLVAEQQKTPPGATPEDNGAPVGESHFESALPMTVARGTSAMVAVVDQAAEGETVYLYNAESERGNEKYAFKSVRLRNPTDSTLESGPVTVYGDGRFIGEGLTDPIPPHSNAIVPFALDRQVVVERTSDTADHMNKLITLSRGVLTAEVQHVNTTRLSVTNRLPTPVVVFVRHTVRQGWTLTRSPDVFERQGDAHLFRVEVAAGKTVPVEIDEATPLTRTVDLRSDAGVEFVRAFLSQPEAEAAFAEPMKKLLALHAEMADHQAAIDSLHERIDEYRSRSDELNVQIVSLRAVKAGGALLAHLQAKMADMSDRIQKATIEVVDHREQMMLARVRFLDGVSELTLAPRVAMK
jgi:hypothetical protein